SFEIRNGYESDVPQILAIQTHYVLNTIATFRTIPPTLSEAITAFKTATAQGNPYLVACSSDAVIGYGYTSQFRPQQAYSGTIELSIYLSPDFTSKGCGRKLLLRLIDDLQKKTNFKQLIAVVAGDNVEGRGAYERLSQFYERFGFVRTGTLKGVGHKFGRWLDTTYFQLDLNKRVCYRC
ncbi:acetyltransferase, partial [Atractiella rhizophila]